METFVIYLLKTGMWIGFFWMVYWLFLRKETFYRFNRYYLLVGSILSFVIPLLQLRYIVEIAVPVSLDSTTTTAVALPDHVSFNWIFALLVTYGCGIIVIAVRYLSGLWKIIAMLMSQPTKKTGSCLVVDSPDVQHPFSVFNYVFINTQMTSDVAQKMILEHEQAHIWQKHWVDLTVCNLICVLQWFNPFAWYYIKMVKQNHEYLADQYVLQKGYSPAIYQAVLLSYTLNTQTSLLVHSFAHAGRASRFWMMRKSVSNPLRKGAVLIVLPALAVFLWAFAQPVYIFEKQNVVEKSLAVVSDTLSIPSKTIESHTVEKSEELQTQTIHQPTDVEPENIESVVQTEYKEIQANGSETLEAVSPKTIPGTDRNINSMSGQTKEQTVSIKVSDTTLEANQPLILLDGVEVPNTTLKTINPDNIQSIDVLKDKSSTALYGEKGKNGVILIKTKPRPSLP